MTREDERRGRAAAACEGRARPKPARATAEEALGAPPRWERGGDHPRRRRRAGRGNSGREGKACAAEGQDAAEGGAGRPRVTPSFPAGTSRLEQPVRAEGGPPPEWEDGWVQTWREEGPRAPMPKARAHPDPREEETEGERIITWGSARMRQCWPDETDEKAKSRESVGVDPAPGKELGQGTLPGGVRRNCRAKSPRSLSERERTGGQTARRLPPPSHPPRKEGLRRSPAPANGRVGSNGG